MSEGGPPDSCLMHSGIGRPRRPQTGKVGVKKNAWMDVFELFMKKKDLSLPQVGGRRWVELFLHSEEKKNLLIIIPKTRIRLTDWPSFEFWFFFFFFWLLLITLFKSCFLFMFRFKCRHRSRRCCVVDWDGTGTTTDLWNLTSGLKRRGASVTKKAVLLPKNLSLFVFFLRPKRDHVQANDALEKPQS